MTQTERVSALLRESAPLSVPEIVRREIDEFRTSERFHEMLSAARYFENRSDIEKKTNDVSPRLSNSRIEHPFYWKFITQKCRYLLARPFSVTTDNPDYAGALNDFFDADFRNRIRAAASDSIEFGIAFLQPYFDEQGVLRIQKLLPTEVIPLWTDAGHDRLDAFIRFYDVVAYVGREKGRITRAEFWDASGVVRMETAFNGTELRVQSTEPHFTVGGKAYNWESPPLVWLRYNDAELPLLRFVKALIDDINWQTSVTSDVLRDVVRCIYVLRGYGGADLAEFVADLRKSLAIKLDADGGVDTLSPQVDTANVLAYLDAARRELYDAASAVDTRDPELGTASGTALLFRYMDLDGDCADLAAGISALFRRLKVYLDAYFKLSGRGDFTGVSFDILCNADMPVNETDIINNARTSSELLSRRTVLANHPWVTDVDAELAAIDEEKQAALERYGEGLFGGENVPDTAAGGTPAAGGTLAAGNE